MVTLTNKIDIDIVVNFLVGNNKIKKRKISIHIIPTDQLNMSIS